MPFSLARLYHLLFVLLVGNDRFDLLFINGLWRNRRYRRGIRGWSLRIMPVSKLDVALETFREGSARYSKREETGLIDDSHVS